MSENRAMELIKSIETTTAKTFARLTNDHADQRKNIQHIMAAVDAIARSVTRLTAQIPVQNRENTSYGIKAVQDRYRDRPRHHDNRSPETKSRLQDQVRGYASAIRATEEARRPIERDPFSQLFTEERQSEEPEPFKIPRTSRGDRDSHSSNRDSHGSNRDSMDRKSRHHDERPSPHRQEADPKPIVKKPTRAFVQPKVQPPPTIPMDSDTGDMGKDPRKKPQQGPPKFTPLWSIPANNYKQVAPTTPTMIKPSTSRQVTDDTVTVSYQRPARNNVSLQVLNKQLARRRMKRQRTRQIARHITEEFESPITEEEPESPIAEVDEE